MTRRVLVVATALALSAGLGGSALASSTDDSHGVCVGLSQSHNGPLDGVCIWIPTDKAQP